MAVFDNSGSQSFAHPSHCRLTILWSKRRSERYGEKLSLLYIDIDSFKRCNDTYGHRVGDQVLEKFSTLIRKELREAGGWPRSHVLTIPVGRI